MNLRNEYFTLITEFENQYLKKLLKIDKNKFGKIYITFFFKR